MSEQGLKMINFKKGTYDLPTGLVVKASIALNATANTKSNLMNIIFLLETRRKQGKLDLGETDNE
jgi:hypothetical protein